jgi:tRNA (mo5U34)-methyltransferase
LTTWTRDELQAMADEVAPHWWHSIDLGHGVVTDGTKPLALMEREIEALRLPDDLTGRSVLDIGAWDGGFSFACERRGARVTALDHYIWSIDLDEKAGYSGRCAAEGVEPRPFEEVPEVWRPDELPGKRGFDTAHRALGSSVVPVVGELETIDLDALGTHDVVLYLGVLYHVLDPFAALKRLARVTGELAVIETEMIRLVGAEGADDQPLFEFLPGSALNDDPTNYWVPNVAALEGMCRAAGFSEARTFVTADPAVEEAADEPVPPLRDVGARARHEATAVRRGLGRFRRGYLGVPEPTSTPRVDLVRFRAVTHARR